MTREEGLGGQVHMIDPDVIVGHNFMGFGLDVLLHRMDQCKARIRALHCATVRLWMGSCRAGFGQ
jgi:DNA polymerase elongation subunit (family B)